MIGSRPEHIAVGAVILAGLVVIAIVVGSGAWPW